MLTFCLGLALSVVLSSSALAVSVPDSLPSKKFRVEPFAYGGPSVLFTSIKSSNVIMLGGRGAATFNNRVTIGGGGWGMLKGIELSPTVSDTLSLFKFGYGGVELGYICYAQNRIQVGANLLFAYGAGFIETKPQSSSRYFKLFPVFEPAVFVTTEITQKFKLDAGVRYRFVVKSHFNGVTTSELRGVSFYVAFLIGAKTQGIKAR